MDLDIALILLPSKLELKWFIDRIKCQNLYHHVRECPQHTNWQHWKCVLKVVHPVKIWLEEKN